MDSVMPGHDGSALTSLRADVEALSEELLNRYEEIALLYDLSRELGVVTDLETSSRTALLRSLQVIPARWGVIVVGDGDGVTQVASAGKDPDGRYAAIAHGAASAALRLAGQVMVHAGGLVDDRLPTVDRVVVRIDPASRLNVHMDTDEANACGLHLTKEIELIK